MSAAPKDTKMPSCFVVNKKRERARVWSFEAAAANAAFQMGLCFCTVSPNNQAGLVRLTSTVMSLDILVELQVPVPGA